MASNFKSFFLFISAFLINVHFTTPVEPTVTEGTHFSETVTETALLEAQENSVLFAQFLINEIVEQDSFQNYSSVEFQLNQSHITRRGYELLQQVAFNHQKIVQLSMKTDDYLFQYQPQVISDKASSPALFQLS